MCMAESVRINKRFSFDFLIPSLISFFFVRLDGGVEHDSLNRFLAMYLSHSMCVWCVKLRQSTEAETISVIT